MPSEAASKRFQREVQTAIRNRLISGEDKRARMNSFSQRLSTAIAQLNAMTALHARLQAEAQHVGRATTEQLKAGAYLPVVVIPTWIRTRTEDGSIQLAQGAPEQRRLDKALIDQFSKEIQAAVNVQPKVILAFNARQGNVFMDHPNARFYQLIRTLQNLGGKNQLLITATDANGAQSQIDIGATILAAVQQPPPQGLGGLELVPRNALNAILKTYVLNRHIDLRNQPGRAGGLGFVMGNKYKNNQLLGTFINASYIDGSGPIPGELQQIFQSLGISQAVIARALEPARPRQRTGARQPSEQIPPGSIRLTVLISRIKGQLQDDLDTYLLSQPTIRAQTEANLRQMTRNPAAQLELEASGGKQKMKPNTRKAYKIAIAPYEQTARAIGDGLKQANLNIERTLKGTLVSPQKRL